MRVKAQSATARLQHSDLWRRFNRQAEISRPASTPPEDIRPFPWAVASKHTCYNRLRFRLETHSMDKNLHIWSLLLKLHPSLEHSCPVLRPNCLKDTAPPFSQPLQPFPDDNSNPKPYYPGFGRTISSPLARLILPTNALEGDYCGTRHRMSAQRDLKGLLGAVNASNAWIITHGLQSDLVKIVSDAISRSETNNSGNDRESPKNVCIGITPWGYIRNRFDLVHSVCYRSPQPHTQYRINSGNSKRGPLSLNTNHTHYILCDNGIRNSFSGSGVVQFRMKFESLLSASPKKGGCGIPVVLLIIGGGYDTLEVAAQRIQHGVPIVICGSTGGIADVLEKAFQFRNSNKEGKGLRQEQANQIYSMLQNLLLEEEEGNHEYSAEKGFEMVQIILANEDFVSCFNPDCIITNNSLDRTILFALIKCISTNPIDQLMVALKFGRIDVVNRQIFDDNCFSIRTSVNRGQLNALMTAALLENRSGFVQFLIDRELVEMSTYLSINTLTYLYNNIDDPTNLRRVFGHYKIELDQALIANQPPKVQVANGRKNTLLLPSKAFSREADNIVNRAICRREGRARQDWIDLPTIQLLLKEILGDFYSPLYVTAKSSNRKMLFPQPMQELFIWALLNNRHQLALIFWREAEDSLALSLIGCNIYGKIVHSLPHYDTEGRQAMDHQKHEFEQYAKSIIGLCYTRSRRKALYLLLRPFTTWGNHQCLPLAMRANCRKFISTIACQDAIRFEWQAGIHANALSVILAYIFPPLVLSSFVTFSYGIVLLHGNSETEMFKRLNRNIKKMDMEKQPDISKWEKFAMFYHAPRTKFCVHTFIKSKEKLSLSTHHFYQWLNGDKWHAYDGVLLVASITTVCLRNGMEETYIVAKTFYSIIFIFYFLRLFQIYSMNRRLGPQSVMIFQMLVELSIFLLILMIFLIPYGIATQALRFPYLTEYDSSYLKNALHFAYYRLYDDVPMEINEKCENSTADGIHCPVYNFVVPLLLAIYMLVVVILLVNLLIAIFSNVFEAVEKESLHFWKATMLRLLFEYRKAPIVPAPFSLFQSLYETITHIYETCIKHYQLSKRLRRNSQSNIEVGRMVGACDAINDVDGESDKELDSADRDIETYKNSVIHMQRWAVRQVLRQKSFKTASGTINTHRIGSKSYIDPRLSLPLSPVSKFRLEESNRFDNLATVSEVLNDCKVAGKLIIILGGTSGIGLHLTKSFIQRGASVICLSREPPPVKWLPLPSFDNFKTPQENHLFWTHLDLTCLQTVIDFAENFSKLGWPIDSVIISAACLPEPTQNPKSVDGFDLTLQVNLFAPFLLVRLLLHRLLITPNSTVVFVSCGALRASNICEPEDIYSTLEPLRSTYETYTGRIQLYANTKFLQVAFAYALRNVIRKRNNQFPILHACCPGQIPESKHVSKASWSAWWWYKILRFITYPFMKTMDCCAAGIAYCALHPAAKDTFNFEECAPISIPEVMNNEKLIRSVWNHINEMMESHVKLPPWTRK
nr:transient receptor potential cation channel [Hymenolepis microstoma]